MASITCVGCFVPLPKDQPVYPARQYRKVGRRIRTKPALVCVPCGSGQVAPITWARVGHPAPGFPDLPPAPCEGCGRLVVLSADPRRRRVVCSPKCATAVAPSKVRPELPERGCEKCGALLDGRTDREYCTGRCRQQAYRDRQK